MDAKGKGGQSTGAYVKGIEAEAIETHCVVFLPDTIDGSSKLWLTVKRGRKKEQNRQCNLSKLLIAHSKYRIRTLSIHLFFSF